MSFGLGDILEPMTNDVSHDVDDMAKLGLFGNRKEDSTTIQQWTSIITILQFLLQKQLHLTSNSHSKEKWHFKEKRSNKVCAFFRT
jgi:hypothetical protein